MAEKHELKCLIAAGGTAGHVLPSLAVAEALAARGAKVTFAGSPDRVEARLVPEAGFELDTFRVSGLPRRPGPALGSRTRAGDARAAGLPADPAGAEARRRARRRRLRGGADGLRRVAAWASRPRSWRRTRTSGLRTGSRRRSPGASSSRSRSRGATGRSTGSPAARSRPGTAQPRGRRAGGPSICRRGPVAARLRREPRERPA